MKPFLQILLLSVPLAGSGGEKELVHPNNPEVRINLDAPDFIKDLGTVKLKIWVIAAGTRSEGLHGIIEGIDDPSDQLTSMDTPEGRIVYRGGWDERRFLWSASGWLPENLSEPFIREVKMEYPLSPLELAVAIEDTLKTVVKNRDRQFEGEHTISYSYSLREGAIAFSLSEQKTVTSSTVTSYVVRYGDRNSKWDRPRNRSELTVRSFTNSGGTRIEELDLLAHRLKQIKEGIKAGRD